MKNNDIGNIIKQARKKKGLTQSELGELMGITAVTVGQWETGKRIPKEETIERISEALEIDLTASINTISYCRTSDILTILYDLACREKLPVELLIKSVISEMEFVLKELELHRRYLNREDINSRQYQAWIKLRCINKTETFIEMAHLNKIKGESSDNYPVTEYIGGDVLDLSSIILEH